MIKKILLFSTISAMIALLIIGFAFKSNLNSYVSKMMRNQISTEVSQSEAYIVDSLYNFTTNGLGYKSSFLEFGAKSCSSCRQMEKVMKEFKSKHPYVKIVFYNILLPENQAMMRYYGISAIPTQVLLDNYGKEYFRHYGYISLETIEKKYLCKK
jgi:thioredoxin 1